MHKSKPFEIIAVQFRISRESAKYFLIRVQKSFKTEKPPHQLKHCLFHSGHELKVSRSPALEIECAR